MIAILVTLGCVIPSDSDPASDSETCPAIDPIGDVALRVSAPATIRITGCGELWTVVCDYAATSYSTPLDLETGVDVTISPSDAIDGRCVATAIDGSSAVSTVFFTTLE